jgi:hypothetical protein
MSTRFSLLFSAVAVALLLGAAGLAHAEMILNGGFEDSPIVYDTTNHTGFTAPGWTGVECPDSQAFWASPGGFAPMQITPGSQGTWITPHAGSESVAFGGFTPGDTLTQTIATSPGVPYTLSFYFNEKIAYSSTPAFFEVSWGGSIVDSMSFTSTGQNFDEWRHYSYTVVGGGTGSDTLQFRGYAGDWFMGLDDVSVVPEPSSLITLLAFACTTALACVWRRRRV